MENLCSIYWYCRLAVLQYSPAKLSNIHNQMSLSVSFILHSFIFKSNIERNKKHLPDRKQSEYIPTVLQDEDLFLPWVFSSICRRYNWQFDVSLKPIFWHNSAEWGKHRTVKCRHPPLVVVLSLYTTVITHKYQYIYIYSIQYFNFNIHEISVLYVS